MSDRERDLEAIRNTYRRYRSEGRMRLWDPANPGYARMVQDRDLALVDLLRRSLPLSNRRVLDLGCGDGRLAEVARVAEVFAADWIGVDLDSEAVRVAALTHPWATFAEGSADSLLIEDGSVDVVVAATLFSSLPSVEMERSVASEIARVLVPGGWLIWYDIRYRNPTNRNVHGIAADVVKSLFPGWTSELKPMTLLPPVARRLGPFTSALYRPLEAIPPLRSHLVGRLRRP